MSDAVTRPPSSPEREQWRRAAKSASATAALTAMLLVAQTGNSPAFGRTELRLVALLLPSSLAVAVPVGMLFGAMNAGRFRRDSWWFRQWLRPLRWV